MSITANFPTIRPTLNLDFVNSSTVDPRITFTRASTATYYDGKTFAKAEENLLVRSQEFDNAAWALERVNVSSNTTIAPDGTTTADTITNTTDTGSHVIRTHPSAVNVVSGVTYTLSVFAKKGTNDFLQLATLSGGGAANFDLQTGVAGSVTLGTSSITSVGDGWYRCTYTFTPSITGSGVFYFGIVTSNTAGKFESYTGLGTESIHLWGAQLEQRSTVTAYTPTTDHPITRYVPQLMTAAANTPRIDFDPVTGECRGLLIEEQRTNLVTWSQEFENAAWVKTRSNITANAIVAPDGTLTADKLIEDSTENNIHGVHRTFTPVGNTTYTFSVYLKKAERTFALVVIGNYSQQVIPNPVFVNLDTGTIVSATDLSRASITNVGNGWYRVSTTSTTIASPSTISPTVLLSADGVTTTYTGDGTSGIYIWGAQLEAGRFPTSYIPTTSSQVTRSADRAVMTGTNFSSWYRQDEGTLLTTFSRIHPGIADGSDVLVSADDGSGANRIQLRLTANTIDAVSIAGGSVQVDAPGIGVPGTEIRSSAFAYKTNDFAFAYAGTYLQTDTSGVVPMTNRLGIGAGGNNVEHANSHIRRIAYYPKRLPNNQLQALTA